VLFIADTSRRASALGMKIIIPHSNIALLPFYDRTLSFPRPFLPLFVGVRLPAQLKGGLPGLHCVSMFSPLDRP